MNRPTRVSMPDREMLIRRSSSSGSMVLCALLLPFGLGCSDRTPELEVSTTTVQAPKPIFFDPPNGSTAVDPARTSLSVTFDREMDPQGWAWVVEAARTAPELGDSEWDPTIRTNTVEAKLEPGRQYVVWVNSPQYLYFKDRLGTAAEPTRWTFSTRSADGTEVPEQGIALRRSTPIGPPRVESLDPPNGADGVDPATTLLKARFDRPMAPSWSWVTEGASFPETTGAAYFETDRRTAVLPVRLEPGRTYVLWLNSELYQLFRDDQDVPSPPLRWTFTTRPAQ